MMADLLLTREQIREIDRRAIDDYGIPGVVLMENAGRSAVKIMRHLVGEGVPKVAIVCGGGNNGGDGYVIARHLHNLGWPVEIYACTHVDHLSGEAGINARIVSRMKLPTLAFDTPAMIERNSGRLAEAPIIVDALLGTGFRGTVRPPVHLAISAINAPVAARRIAIDVPSGLDCDTGEPAPATVRANETITFVARKRGFDLPAAQAFIGTVYVADIGAPRELIASYA